MRWRQCTQVFNRLNHGRVIPTSANSLRPKWQFPTQLRLFHSLDGKVTPPKIDAKDTPLDILLETRSQPDWNEELDKVMAHQELRQLQQFLGLVKPENGKPVEDVIFVCIDLEAFELNQEKITEIGVSVLESRSVKDVDPGNDGKPWFDLMKHLHLRPIEHKRFINRRFVQGCPDHFNFGTSVSIKLEDAGRILDRIFRDPCRIHEACDLMTEIPDVEPSIMLVGHDLKNDTDYLKRLNFTPKHVAGKIDTQRMARISKRLSPGLKKLLAALSIDAENLHNAGNDAAYTLQALVGVAVQEYRQPGGTVKTLLAEREVLDAARAAKKAEQARKTKPARRAKPAEGARPGGRSPEANGVTKTRRVGVEARDPSMAIASPLRKVPAGDLPIRRYPVDPPVKIRRICFDGKESGSDAMTGDAPATAENASGKTQRVFSSNKPDADAKMETASDVATNTTDQPDITP